MVVLSRTDVTAIDKINTSLEVVRGINDSCVVVTTPINELSDEDLLDAYEGNSVSLFEEVLAEHDHHHHHDEECECGCHQEHHHHAHEVFNSVSIETAKIYCFEELNTILNKLAYTKDYGMIIRAKGIVKTTEGWKKFNITPEELVIEDNNALVIGSICVIGVEISTEEIKSLF